MSKFQRIRTAMRLMAAVVLSLLVTFGVSAQAVRYIHTDGLGSVVLVTDKDRNTVDRSEYEPYGNLLNRPITDGPGYTGHAMDSETGLSYMQQRYYDPTISRFLSIDPVTVNSVSGINFNRYWYASNNPYGNIDPDGRYVCKAGKDQCAAVSAAINKIKKTPSSAPTGSHITGGRNSEIANFYGKEGEDNGVTVQAGAPGSAGNAITVNGKSTISINFTGLEGAVKNFVGFSYQDLVDSTLLHEGSHGYDQKMRFKNGFKAMTKSEHQYLQGERRAYRAEAAFYESLQADSPWGLWTRRSGINNAEIERQARESVNISCASGRCDP